MDKAGELWGVWGTVHDTSGGMCCYAQYLPKEIAKDLRDQLQELEDKKPFRYYDYSYWCQPMRDLGLISTKRDNDETI